MNHDVSLAGIYKWVFFSASYQYVKDAIVGIVEAYKEGEPINLMTYMNYDHISNIQRWYLFPLNLNLVTSSPI